MFFFFFKYFIFFYFLVKQTHYPVGMLILFVQSLGNAQPLTQEMSRHCCLQTFRHGGPWPRRAAEGLFGHWASPEDVSRCGGEDREDRRATSRRPARPAHICSDVMELRGAKAGTSGEGAEDEDGRS